MGSKRRFKGAPLALKVPTALEADRPPARVTVSFRRIDSGSRFCLSQCDEYAVREFMNCLRKMSDLVWIEACKVCRWETYPDHILRHVTRPDFVGKDRVGRFEAGGPHRLYGFRDENDVFCVLWFDPRHEIVPLS
jgi:hypothetical protein